MRAKRWKTAAAAALAVGAALGVSGTAFANAPNGQTITAQTTVNANGTVTVSLSGTWLFSNQSCSGRYGVGWAVDWQDPSLTTYPLSSKSGPGPGPGSGGGVTLNLTSNYDGTDTDLCATSTGTTDSTGPWTASHTYSSLSKVPTGQLCTNFYDMHGSAGKPSMNPSDNIAAGPNHDGDNSLQNGQWTASGDCVQVPSGVSVAPGLGSWALPLAGGMVLLAAVGGGVMVVRRRSHLATED